MNRLRASVFAMLALFGSAVFFASPAEAGQNDAVRGWAWSDRAGWISLNCLTAGGCLSSDYGVDLADTVVGAGYQLTGWAWSPHIGWICFGSTCNTYGPPPGGSGNGPVPAYLDAAGTEVHGWAYIVSLGSAGWVSLNCDTDPNIASSCTTYRVLINRSTGVVSGFAWNSNTNGNGIGWIDFSFATLSGAETICNDGLDNDSDGLIDCADPDCANQAGPGGGVCGEESGPLRCQDSYDNDGDGAIDCADQTTCWHVAASGCPANEIPEPLLREIVWPPVVPTCSDGVDNDHDNGSGGYDNNPLTGIDCQDSDCFTDRSCPMREDTCLAGDAVSCCTDNVDGDADSALDCADSDCTSVCIGQCQPLTSISCAIDAQCPGSKNEPARCDTSRPWLQALYQDIYSRRSIRSAAPPPAGEYNATFCLLTAPGGSVTNFVAQPGSGGASGCPTAPQPTDYPLPNASNLYTTPLGRIDIPGMKRGVYGQVVTAATFADVPDVLGGKVYYFPNGLTINTGRTFRNGILRQSGAGTVLVEGVLRIEQPLAYDGASAVSYMRNLAALGFVVVDRRDAAGTVTVPARVEIIAHNVVGNFYSEGTIATADVAAKETAQLTVNGFLIGRRLDFLREQIAGGGASERVFFDGRAVANPPPGMADLSKSLPTFSSVAPR